MCGELGEFPCPKLDVLCALLPLPLPLQTFQFTIHHHSPETASTLHTVSDQGQDQRSLLPPGKKKRKKKRSVTKNKNKSSEPLLNTSSNQPQLLTFRGSPRLFLSESNSYHITGRGISFAHPVVVAHHFLAQLHLKNSS